MNPDLVVRDKEGKPYTVRYEQVNAMLLNEFLKEHATVQEQGATITRQRKDFEAAIAQQQKQIEALTATVKSRPHKSRTCAHSSPQRVRPVADLKRANSPQDESAVADPRPRWSRIPKAAASRNQPSRFTPWQLSVLRATLTTL